jgi:hypothetical protein
MLTPIVTPDPKDLNEISRESPRFDKLTNDTGDLRVYASADGTKKFLRVWEGASNRAGGDDRSGPRWYEIAPAQAPTPTATK